MNISIFIIYYFKIIITIIILSVLLKRGLPFIVYCVGCCSLWRLQLHY